MALDVELAAFFGAQTILVGYMLLVRRPYRAGRNAFATYDLLCTLSVAGAVGAAVVGHHGVSLWLIGTVAAFCGIGAGMLLEALPLYALASRRPVLVYAGSALVCLMAALLGGAATAAALVFVGIQRQV